MGARIVAYARTPFHPAHKGELASVRPEDMTGVLAKEMMHRTGIEANDVEDVYLGCAYPEGVQGLNLGRITTYMAGLPHSVPGATTNRLCGSSMQVIHTAAGAISLGSGKVFLCGGVETMSLVKRGGWNRDLHPGLEERYPDAYISMGMTAENLANQYNIGRITQEEFAFHSHSKAFRARESGYFDAELVGVETPAGVVNRDGCIRETTLEKMANLAPAFLDSGSVTAATSSPLTDGSAFVAVTSTEYADENSLGGFAELVSSAVAGVDPSIMGIGPVPACQKALQRAGLSMDEMDVIELNEAFSSQSLAVCADLQLDYLDDRLNIDGGALALGHPLGASGARITGKAASLLQRKGGEYALAAMCIGGGMGIATVLRNC